MHEHIEYRGTRTHMTGGVAGGVATSCSNTDLLVPLGSFLTMRCLLPWAPRNELRVCRKPSLRLTSGLSPCELGHL